MNSWPRKVHSMNSSKTNDTTGTSAVNYQIEESIQYLQHLPFFRDAPLDILKLHAYLSRKEEFSQGSWIAKQGESAPKMALILQGEVSIHERHHNREYKLQQLSAEGMNYFGELTILSQSKQYFSAYAETDVTLLTISREAFQKIVARYPESFPKIVEKIIDHRIKRYTDQTKKLIDKIPPHAW